MKKILFLLVLVIFSCQVSLKYKPGTYSLDEIKRKSQKLKLPENDVFYIDPDLFVMHKKRYGKVPIRFQGFLLLNSNGDVLKIDDDSCPVGLLYDANYLSDLEMDSITDKRIFSYYKGLNERIKSKPYTFLIFWLAGIPQFTFKQNKKIVMSYRDKCHDSCQILYLNTNIYKEIYNKLDKNQ